MIQIEIVEEMLFLPASVHPCPEGTGAVGVVRVMSLVEAAVM